jgi:hypothetical protein
MAMLLTFWRSAKVTPSEPVSCPMDAGNVRDDDYPDRSGDPGAGGRGVVYTTGLLQLWANDSHNCGKLW